MPVFARRFSVIRSIVVFVSALSILPTQGLASAQKVAVAKVTGRSAKSLSPPGHVAIGAALKALEVDVLPWDDYLAAADARGIPAEQVTATDMVPGLAQDLSLHAVVIGATKWKEGPKKTELSLTVLDAQGQPLATRDYSFAGRASIPADTLEAIATDLKAVFEQFKLGAPPAPTGPMDTESPKEKVSAAPEIEAPPPEETRADAGALSDALIAVGMALNLRRGLEPSHDSHPFPGVRLDGHLFAGAFTDTKILRDFGLRGLFHKGFALEYAPTGGGQTWSSSHLEWRAELLYRLALLDDTLLEPAFVLRAGLGGLVSTIDAPATVEDVRSVGYLAPQVGLDVYLTLFDPFLRLRLGGAFLFAVQAREELNGDASGFSVDAGVDVVLLDWLHTSAGWELARYAIDDRGVTDAPAMGETADLYNTFYVRVGWSFDRP